MFTNIFGEHHWNVCYFQWHSLKISVNVTVLPQGSLLSFYSVTISLGPFCPDISFCISGCLQGGQFYLYTSNRYLRVQKSLIERSSHGMHNIIFKTLLPHLQEVYKQAVWTKRFQMFHSTCQSDLTIVHQVYNGWWGFKVTSTVTPHR